ncbi:FHA domain-containing protein [Haliangium sp.]|uniref:FHA domain-containing protein n=1 Tax=Haliangium sp. TaxID=2663208 RepID=UPI003D11FEA7
MGARLLYRDSHGRDGQVSLSPDAPCYVGRALDCAIRTDDPMVSRKHSMIRMEGDGYFIEDLGSSNGTHVNEERVSKRRLAHNDVLRCGSLVLRYVEDGPLVPARAASQVSSVGGPQGSYAGHPGGQPPAVPGAGGYGGSPSHAQPAGGGYQPGATGYQPGGPSPMGKPGTQRLDTGNTPPGGQSGIYGGSAANRGPDGPPAMPHGGGVAGQSGYGPPDMPAEGNPFGPPSMPGAGAAGPGAQGAGVNPFARPGEAAPAAAPAMDSEAVAKLNKDLDSTRKRLDDLQSNYDREVADGKRLRAESATLRERIQQLGETIADGEEQIKVHQGVAEELRGELSQARDDLAQARTELAEMAEDMHAKERQIGRIQDDIAKLKDEKEDIARQLTEVSKTKDEGWKKLNEQLGEIEHLREVINEQERMLEERKVGLISQEEAIKELRADKERQIKAFAQVKAEHEEVLGDLRRQSAQLQAVDEENKRLSRLLGEIQAGGGGAQGATVDLTNELREARIEVRKLESDRDRSQEMYERADAEAKRLEARLAQLEVELRETNERKVAATSTQSVIKESLAKAEVARHKAAEEALQAAKERDEAVAAAEKAQRENDRLRGRVEDLEANASSGRDDTELRAENEAIKRKLELAETRTEELERTLDELRADLEEARTEVEDAREHGGGGRADTLESPAEAGDGGGVTDAIRAKAMEVYENINDILSEIRNNLRMVQAEFEIPPGERSDDSARIMNDTLQTLVDNAEDAKGVVRGLRELAEFG